MSRHGDNLERHAAKVLGGARTAFRGRYEPAPDIQPLILPNGSTALVECKYRRVLPKLVTGALAQALRYAPDAVPIAVLRELRGPALIVMRLADFAALSHPHAAVDAVNGITADVCEHESLREPGSDDDV